MNRCTRYSEMGFACPNEAGYDDGWCRRDGCPGFTRPHSFNAPALKDVKFYGSPEEIAATSANPAIIKGTPADIAVWPAAINNFKFHHGGTADDAKVQMRWMLADFLAKSGKVVSETNYLVLSRDGYRVHVAPSRDRITGYSTVHRERTWEQFKRGVPSRIGRIDAKPMPIQASLKMSETRPASPKKLEPIRLDAPKSLRPKPAAPKPGKSMLASRAVATPPTTNVSLPFPAETKSHHVNSEPAAPRPDLMAGQPHPVSEPFDTIPLPPAARADEVCSAALDEPKEPAAHAAPITGEPARPVAVQHHSTASGPSTLATAAISVLSTLVVVRVARWLRRGPRPN